MQRLQAPAVSLQVRVYGLEACLRHMAVVAAIVAFDDTVVISIVAAAFPLAARVCTIARGCPHWLLIVYSMAVILIAVVGGATG